MFTPKALLRIVLSSLAILSTPVLCLAQSAQGLQEVRLEQTFYYSGDMNGTPWQPSPIDVDAGGTVALGVNRSFGPGNFVLPNDVRAQVVLYDKAGEPIGGIACPVSGIADVCFGPDGRVYTAESWFGAGTHIWDRPGAKDRYVPVRIFKSDGSHVDKGTPTSVGVGADYRMYSVLNGKLSIMSPEDKLIKQVDKAEGAVKIAPDGVVYCGSKMLQADGTWKTLKFLVRDVAPDGKLLVAVGPQWGILDPKKAAAAMATGEAGDLIAALDAKVTLPPGQWGNMALGPDGNVYLAPQNNPGLGYVVASPDGKIILSRGADFDRLSVTLKDKRMTAGTDTTIAAITIRSRDLDYVPKSVQLPEDNRPELKVRAFVAPVVRDPLGESQWAECPLTASGGGQYSLAVPVGLHGSYDLRFIATPPMKGATALEVKTTVWIQPADAKAYLAINTDRGRTGFAAGQPIRFTVPVDALGDADLTNAVLLLAGKDGQSVLSAPLGLKIVAAKSNPTAVVIVPGEGTLRLKPGEYLARCNGLPERVGTDTVVIVIADPVRRSDFETVFHPIGAGELTPADARVHAQMGASHVSTYSFGNAGNAPLVYADVALRLGMTYHLQPYSHFAAINTLPQEQGATQQYFAFTAQRLQTYPAFRGFNYHDLYAPFGTWWDAPRKELYLPLWDEWGRKVQLPESVPADKRKAVARAYGESFDLPQAYRSWGEAIRHAVPELDRTTMQWWHLPLVYADPDKVAADQNVITTQHMEEQYYHPVTVANQVDLWRQPGKPLWCFGNTAFQDDGSGAETYREMMAGWARGVQGLGRNYLPQANSSWSERIHRLVTPAFELLQRYGGIAAVCEPADDVVIWRSLFQEAQEDESRPMRERHLFNTTAAYTACLYAHRTAGIITDGRVRAGDLKKYKAVIISFERAIPGDLAVRLVEFQKAGGLVLANKPARGYWAPPGAVELGSLFGESYAQPDHNDDIDRWWLLQENEGGIQAKKVLEAMGDKIVPLAECDDPSTWISVLASGKAKYILTVNMKLLPIRPADLHRYAAFQNTAMPTRSTLRLTRGDYVIYDVFAGKQITPKEEGGKWLVEADMTLFPGAVIALLPKPIHDVQMMASSPSDGSGAMGIYAGALAAQEGSEPPNQLLPVPLEVTVSDTTGAARYHFYRTTGRELGMRNLAVLPIAANDAAGAWTVKARELISGHEFAGQVKVRPPVLPKSFPVSAVEWTRKKEIQEALKKAKYVAIVMDEKQKDIAPAVATLKDFLAKQDKNVTEVKASQYLEDRKTLGWEKFQIGGPYQTGIKLRTPKTDIDLIVALDLPGQPSTVIPLNALPIEPTATDPGAGRGLVQFVAMPVYDTEDAISIAGGDVAGLLAAVASLADPPPSPREVGKAAVEWPPLEDIKGTAKQNPPAGLSDLIGVPAAEVAASSDGERVAVAMRGWGNNLFVLDGKGNVLSKDVCGKFYPMRLRALDTGFSVLEHESDAAVLYTKLYDRDGKPVRRLAAPGRRIIGTGAVSISHPQIINSKLAQASFSVTRDGRFAAVGGSKAIAVWDLAAGKVRWRDDQVHHEPAATSEAAAFPQVILSPDGRFFALQHNGKMTLRDGATGKVTGQVTLPLGSIMGPVQLYDGHLLVMGDSEFFGFRDGQLQWWWKAPPDDVTACAFAADGLHYVVGQPSGALRMMKGGGQIGGFVAPSGGILSVAIAADSSRVAYATATGHVGVISQDGSDVWHQNVGTRAAIAFAGKGGETVVSDWRGIVRRYDGKGKEVWATHLTPLVYRNDLAALLTKPDPTDTLRVPAPDVQHPAPPEGKRNLALEAQVTLTLAKTSGWQRPIAVQKDGGAVLNNGKADDITKPWFDIPGMSYMVGSEYKFPLTWELAWKTPVKVDTVIVRECSQHPEAVPEEIAIEAWIDEGDWHGWKRLVHDRWNSGVVHVHRFPAVTTSKLRYLVCGDFGNSLWTTEIEVPGD